MITRFCAHSRGEFPNKNGVANGIQVFFLNPYGLVNGIQAQWVAFKSKTALKPTTQAPCQLDPPPRIPWEEAFRIFKRSTS